MKSETHSIKKNTIAFFLGLALIFTLLGVGAAFLGATLKSISLPLTKIAGSFILVFGVFLLAGKGFGGAKLLTPKKKTPWGSFLFGGGFALAWTPCTGPILIAILTLATTATTAISGGALLFTYALGLSIPLYFLAFVIEKINQHNRFWKIVQGKEIRVMIFKKEFVTTTTNVIAGIFFIALGVLMIADYLFIFNRYVAGSSFQQYLFNIEEKLQQLLT